MRFAALTLLALSCAAANAAPLLHSNDFIANNQRTALVDFSTLSNGSGLAPNFSQAGVNVRQVNGQGNDIWSSCGLSCWYGNGSLSWYASGGDNGWTEISRAGGADFGDVGMDIGSIRFGYDTVQYELLNNGLSVLGGNIGFAGGSDGYLGFSGGGFDTIRLRAAPDAFNGGFGNGAFQALAIDNIELAAQRVPEPASLALLGAAVLGAGLARRRKSR